MGPLKKYLQDLVNRKHLLQHVPACIKPLEQTDQQSAGQREVTRVPGCHSWLDGKESVCQCRSLRRCEFDTWVGKIPWRREWQTTPLFLPGESRGQMSLAGYSSSGHKELGMSQLLNRRRQWQPTPVLLLGKSHGRRSLVGCSPWGH